MGEVNSKQTLFVICQLFRSAMRQSGGRTRGWRQCNFRFRRAFGDLRDEHHRQSARALRGEQVWHAAETARRPLWLESKRQVLEGNLERWRPWGFLAVSSFSHQLPKPSHRLAQPPSQRFIKTIRREFSLLSGRAGEAIMHLFGGTFLALDLPLSKGKRNSRRHPRPYSVTGNFLPIVCVCLS